MPIAVGSQAPSFELPDQDGRKRKLKEFAGKWVVLYFYPKDDTPGCTIQATEFTAGVEQFEELDAVILGVSPDPQTAHQKFIARHSLNITLLSDTERSVMAAYGAWGEKSMYGKKVTGVIRSTVLIDPAGQIAHHWKSVRSKGHAEKVREKLQELRG
jgi:peroxiredoxin Q/BCP